MCIRVYALRVLCIYPAVSGIRAVAWVVCLAEPQPDSRTRAGLQEVPRTRYTTQLFALNSVGVAFKNKYIF